MLLEVSDCELLLAVGLTSSRLTTTFHISQESEASKTIFLLTKRTVHGYPGGKKCINIQPIMKL